MFFVVADSRDRRRTFGRLTVTDEGLSTPVPHRGKILRADAPCRSTCSSPGLGGRGHLLQGLVDRTALQKPKTRNPREESNKERRGSGEMLHHVRQVPCACRAIRVRFLVFRPNASYGLEKPAKPLETGCILVCTRTSLCCIPSNVLEHQRPVQQCPCTRRHADQAEVVERALRKGKGV